MMISGEAKRGLGIRRLRMTQNKVYGPIVTGGLQANEQS
jgi:hypothetical protein